ncbi:hypothetical protein F2Q68_00016205 [Brassica cretica]|uniref:Uncharacterized protein n=1 Tax=Brassica cretica TaxID=69181 RepID=A0A8S9HFL5_BRACR|nr:hypothetical protein F2Q68_00016205 [Brassica cretica]
MPSSTTSNKETQLLFSPDPASMEHSIRKEGHSSSIGNNTCSSLDFVQLPSTQTLVPSTDTRSPPSTEDTHLPSTDIVHPTSIDTPSQTSIDTKPRDMVATLILVRDNNGDVHDQDGPLRNAASQRIVGVKIGHDGINTSDKSSKKVATQRSNACSARSLHSNRARAKAQSLRSDRASFPLGRYVATELKPKLGRFVVTELEQKLGRYVATELFRNVDTTLVHAFSSTLRFYLPKTVANPFHVPRHSKLSIELYHKNRGKIVLYRKKP